MIIYHRITTKRICVRTIIAVRFPGFPTFFLGFPEITTKISRLNAPTRYEMLPEKAQHLKIGAGGLVREMFTNVKNTHIKVKPIRSESKKK